MGKISKLLIFLSLFLFIIYANACTFNNDKNVRIKQDGMVYYEVFVRSFYDSDGDGIGDIKGLTEKLSYIKSLGVNGIWLMPIFKSPSYHGYDVTDYYNINSEYGTNEDFERFLKRAHEMGMKVILDLVINHTSSKHPWFLNADTSPNSKYRNFYIWADKDTNTSKLSPFGTKQWHNKGSGFYNGIFWSEMPDLNFDNKNVRKEIKKIAKYWLEKGVDGFRLDAAMHIYPPERTQDTLEWWDEFSQYCRSVKKDVYLVGEVWSNERAIAPYLKYLDSCFNFTLSESIIGTVINEDSSKLQYSLPFVYDEYKNSYKDYVDAPFLTNHDMERVMNRVANIDKMKLASAILLMMPGNPFIYYGEEIGMKGLKPDEYIREPFKWYRVYGRGQTKWEESIHNLGDYSPSVEQQESEPDSLLNHYRNLIKLRQSYSSLSKGDLSLIKTDSNVFAFKRTFNNETMVIVFNVTSKKVTTDIDAGVNIEGINILNNKNVKHANNIIYIELQPYSYAILK
ncbi:alpha-amylase family glycosyl hydrolase [Caloramator mitchellensis]|nr:alpha-amylase family glycosyl hydrolase [Caloramator mitchellensis]